MACASIIGDAYYFYLNNSDSADSKNYKCIELNGATVSSCDSKSFNEYALSMN